MKGSGSGLAVEDRGKEDGPEGARFGREDGWVGGDMSTGFAERGCTRCSMGSTDASRGVDMLAPWGCYRLNECLDVVVVIVAKVDIAAVKQFRFPKTKLI